MCFSVGVWCHSRVAVQKQQGSVTAAYLFSTISYYIIFLIFRAVFCEVSICFLQVNIIFCIHFAIFISSLTERYFTTCTTAQGLVVLFFQALYLLHREPFI